MDQYVQIKDYYLQLDCKPLDRCNIIKLTAYGLMPGQDPRKVIICGRLLGGTEEMLIMQWCQRVAPKLRGGEPKAIEQLWNCLELNGIKCMNDLWNLSANDLRRLMTLKDDQWSTFDILQMKNEIVDVLAGNKY